MSTAPRADARAEAARAVHAVRDRGVSLERALPENRWIDRIPVTPTSPQEDEVGIASMTELSFYHGIYFPRRFDALIDRGLFFDGCAPADVARWETRFTYFLRKLNLQQPGRRLLIKNPVYTGRVAQLRRLFPDAIEADLADAEWLGLNAVSDGKHVVLPVQAERLAAQVAERGFVPVTVDVSELLKAGGGPKCCTLELRRS